MILLIDNYDSFVFNVAQYLSELTDEEVKTVRNDALTLAEYPTDDDELSLTERISFLFGTGDGYCRFVRMCEKEEFDIRDIKWY